MNLEVENRLTPIYSDIRRLFLAFEFDHSRAIKGSKSAGVRARQGTNKLRKALKEYRLKFIELEKGL